jgi:hypothetical protein
MTGTVVAHDSNTWTLLKGPADHRRKIVEVETGTLFPGDFTTEQTISYLGAANDNSIHIDVGLCYVIKEGHSHRWASTSILGLEPASTKCSLGMGSTEEHNRWVRDFRCSHGGKETKPLACGGSTRGVEGSECSACIYGRNRSN